MGDFWGRAKSGFAEAADVSKRAAMRTKAKADLELLKRKLTKLKHDFGVEVFPFFESDRAKADAIYVNYKQRVEELAGQIHVKQQEINSLSKKGAEAGSGPATGAPPPPPPRGDDINGPSMSEI